MTFLVASALALVAFVVAPFVAHLLRRRRAEARIFPPAALVPATDPRTLRRSALEDRLLFLVRALIVLGLALLGATPFIRCSRLTLARHDGASVAVAIVLDDSLSMRARLPDGTPRFVRALRAAKELTSGLSQGDAVALVLAGSPPRIALGGTTSLVAAAKSLDFIEPSDRATDLDGAVRMAKGLLSGLPHRDKRVILLSDLADGSPEDAAPLTGDADITLWQPLPELEADGSDCAVLEAAQSGSRVTVQVACAAAGPPSRRRPGATASAAQPAPRPSEGRAVVVRSDEKVVASIALSGATDHETVTLDVPGSLTGPLRAALTGKDAIAEDDVAPVSLSGGPLRIAAVTDLSATQVATGGPTPLEQAFAALETDARIRSLPTVPDETEALGEYSGMVVDDAPGLTPAARRGLFGWVKRGGVLLLTLGPRAAAAPLGANFDPLVPGVFTWGTAMVRGVDVIAGHSFLGPSADALADMAPRGRTTLPSESMEGAEVLLRWHDGAPLFLKRSIGRGVLLTLTLPLATDQSDFVLRPAFLAFLDKFVALARSQSSARRIDVGDSWTFDGASEVTVAYLPNIPKAPPKPIQLAEEGSPVTTAAFTSRARRAVAPLAGHYAVRVDGESSVRAATVPEREIQLGRRRLQGAANRADLGGVTPALDISRELAMVLMLLLTLELVLRVVDQVRSARALRAHPPSA